ncbi:MAG: pyridoxamine 5'-phosphate oxidase, partial [Calditrichaeota bacterium]
MERLNESSLPDNPLELFGQWLEAAQASGVDLPEAMVLATADEQGRPSARMVLLKGFSEQGLLFFTNYQSRKARELAANPRAALLFYWRVLHRQIRIEGRVEKASRETAEQYFRQRPLRSRVSAWISPQSRPVPDRKMLEGAFQQFLEKTPGKAAHCPPYWGGYWLKPEYWEFWLGHEDRLH